MSLGSRCILFILYIYGGDLLTVISLNFTFNYDFYIKLVLRLSSSQHGTTTESAGRIYKRNSLRSAATQPRPLQNMLLLLERKTNNENKYTHLVLIDAGLSWAGLG